MSTSFLVDGMRLYADLTGNISTPTYTELADIREIGSPGDPQAPDVDVTALFRSVNRRQFKQGLFDTGEFTFKQYWTKARYDALIDAREAKLPLAWRVTFPDNATPANASKEEFTGYLKSVVRDPATNPDDPILISVTVKLTNAMTFTQGT